MQNQALEQISLAPRGASDDPLWSAQEVRRDLGNISETTLWRWERDPEMNFPAPTVINRRRYWPRSVIQAFRARMQRRAA